MALLLFRIEEKSAAMRRAERGMRKDTSRPIWDVWFNTVSF